MNITPLHWLFAALLAISVHMSVFIGFELDDNAKIERAAGVTIGVGTLSSYASQSDVQDASTEELVDDTESETVKEEKPDQVEADEATNDVSETINAETPEEVEISQVQPETTEVVQETPKPPAQSPEKPDVANPVITSAPVLEKIPDETVAPTVIKKTAVKVKTVRRKKTVQKKKSAKRKSRTGMRTVSAHRGAGGGGRQKSVSGSAAFSNYRGRVRARLASRIRRPAGLKGRVVLRFTIVRSGRATGAHIVKSSNAKLNRLALAAARGSFQAIPRGMPGKITFTIPINFR